MADTIIKVSHRITPQEWCDYWITLIEGRGCNYWAEWLTVQHKPTNTRAGWREATYLDGTDSGREPGIWADKWRVQVRLFADDVGFIDPGVKSGPLVRRYFVNAESFARVAELDPELFGRFVDRENQDFDTGDAEVMLQLAVFGHVVFG